MSKYSKMLAMKNGKMKVQHAVFGTLASLLARKGASKGVEMITMSNKAIREGARTAANREKFSEALGKYKKGETKDLENLKVKDFENAMAKEKTPSTGITKEYIPGSDISEYTAEAKSSGIAQRIKDLFGGK
jgi:hypothetical protein